MGGALLHLARADFLFSVCLSVCLQVFDDCHDGGEISPSNCIYMSEWLDF